MAFIDLEKAIDRVPWEVIWWALRESGVEERLISEIGAGQVKSSGKYPCGVCKK